MSSASPRGSATALARVAILALAVTVAACSRSEPEVSKPRASAPVEAPQRVEAAVPAAETTEGLRERLARQEAASKLFDKAEPVKASEPVKTPEPVKKAEPVKIAEPVKKAEAVNKPEPVKKAEPVKAPEPAKADPPKSEAVKPQVAKAAEPHKGEAEKLAAPRVEPKAPPRPATTPAPAVARLVSRVDPEFPREAVQAGTESGSVKARLTLDAAGNVAGVEVIEAFPRRVFDRAVVRALSQWRYSEGAAGRLVDVEIAFKR
jgi:protein TonB